MGQKFNSQLKRRSSCRLHLIIKTQPKPKTTQITRQDGDEVWSLRDWVFFLQDYTVATSLLCSASSSAQLVISPFKRRSAQNNIPSWAR